MKLNHENSEHVDICRQGQESFPVVLPRSELLLQVREMLLLTILWT